MNRMILGAVAALLLAAAGLFWWQGRAETERGSPPPLAPRLAVDPESLPIGEADGLVGLAPPEASEATREQRRFDRVDRNRDQIITRNEMLALRASAFKALDTDHNNLLTFEEWAVRTSNKFKGADANGDARLTRSEFSATRPKPARKPDCKCVRTAATRASSPRRPESEPVLDELDETEPAI